MGYTRKTTEVKKETKPDVKWHTLFTMNKTAKGFVANVKQDEKYGVKAVIVVTNDDKEIVLDGEKPIFFRENSGRSQSTGKEYSFYSGSITE